MMRVKQGRYVENILLEREVETPPGMEDTFGKRLTSVSQENIGMYLCNKSHHSSTSTSIHHQKLRYLRNL